MSTEPPRSRIGDFDRCACRRWRTAPRTLPVQYMSERFDIDAEWLEPRCQGGFGCRPGGGDRTRRYHALLLTATKPPTGRIALVQGFEAWVETANARVALSTQRYVP